MELTSFAEARNTREKLRRLERLHDEQSRAEVGDHYARELSLRSLREMIHQLKQELALFEARAAGPDPEAPGEISVSPSNLRNPGDRSTVDHS